MHSIARILAAAGDLKSRAGDLAVRAQPLGRSAQPGASVYVGKQLGKFNIGVLYENKRNKSTFSGLMLQLRPTRITKALGRYMVDYSRQPEGFTAQIPLLHLRMNESTHIRSGEEARWRSASGQDQNSLAAGIRP